MKNSTNPKRAFFSQNNVNGKTKCNIKLRVSANFEKGEIEFYNLEKKREKDKYMER